MDIRLLRREPNELRIEIAGEGHTFCNMLQKALLEDKMVEMAGYDVPHPLVAKAIVYVRTKSKRKPETAIRNAAKNVLKRSKELRKALEKALEEFDEAAHRS